MRQNLETTSEQVLEEKGRRVRLEWRPEHTLHDRGEGSHTNETQVETGHPAERGDRCSSRRPRSSRPAAAAGAGEARRRQVSESNLPQSIGKGEGALNLIEWPYYSDKSFAKKFEEQTGCKIKRRTPAPPTRWSR